MRLGIWVCYSTFVVADSANTASRTAYRADPHNLPARQEWQRWPDDALFYVTEPVSTTVSALKQLGPSEVLADQRRPVASVLQDWPLATTIWFLDAMGDGAVFNKPVRFKTTLASPAEWVAKLGAGHVGSLDVELDRVWGPRPSQPLRVSGLARMTPEQRGAALGRLIADAKVGKAEGVRARIKVYEDKYGFDSAEMLARFSRGELEDTQDTAAWQVLLKAVR